MTALRYLYLYISALSFTTTTYSFLPAHTTTYSRRGRILCMGRSRKGDSSGDEMFNAGPFGKNKAKGGPRQFLTQRAIQSFMYLLSTQRDPHTINYLEDFLQ